MDTPAPTIRGVNRPKPSEYKKHDSDPVDPSNIRAMTTRERARIQTFPDTFVFPENTANTEQMIGNAVPVQLATFVASSLSDFVDGKQYSCNMQFIDWLKSNKGFTNRAAGDIVSRIIRANKIVPIKLLCRPQCSPRKELFQTEAKTFLPKTRKTLKPLWLQGFYLARKRGFEFDSRMLYASKIVINPPP